MKNVSGIVLLAVESRIVNLRPPVQSSAAEGVDVGALGASVAGDTPEVLVQGVGASDLAVPLTALLGALLNGGSRGSRGNAQHDGSSSKELHIVGGCKGWV